MSITIDELLEKYEDVRDSADDWVEKNLAQEIIDDLRGLKHG